MVGIEKFGINSLLSIEQKLLGIKHSKPSQQYLKLKSFYKYIDFQGYIFKELTPNTLVAAVKD